MQFFTDVQILFNVWAANSYYDDFSNYFCSKEKEVHIEQTTEGSTGRRTG
jgi:hypothetical protein